VRLARAVVVPLALGIAGTGAMFACGDDLVLDAPEAGAKDGTTTLDGAACTAVLSCNGRCGRLKSECNGFEVDCNPCAAPNTCNGENRCECKDVTCQAAGATCGVIPKGCRQETLDCGTCQVGTCQKLDGGLGCSTAICTPEGTATTCAPDKCGPVVNNCVQIVNCTCAGKFCIGGATGSLCDCPKPLIAIHGYVATGDQDTVRCYDVPGQCNTYGVVDPPVFMLHQPGLPELVPLYRCEEVSPGPHNTYFTTKQPCPGGGVGGIAGYCSPTPICGALPLHRFRDGVGSPDYAYALGTTPPFTDYFLHPAADSLVCYAWPPTP